MGRFREAALVLFGGKQQIEMREAVAYEDATDTSFRRISQSNRDLIPFKYDKGVQMSF